MLLTDLLVLEFDGKKRFKEELLKCWLELGVKKVEKSETEMGLKVCLNLNTLPIIKGRKPLVVFC